MCLYLASGLSTCTFLGVAMHLFFKSVLVWFTQVLSYVVLKYEIRLVERASMFKEIITFCFCFENKYPPEVYLSLKTERGKKFIIGNA